MTMREPVEVAAGAFVFTSRREQTTSTVIIAAGPPSDGLRALLVDPAWEPDELAAIAAFLRGRAATVTAGFATHSHEDHVLWHPDFGAAPRWASAVTAANARWHRRQLIEALAVGDSPWPPELAKLVGRLAALPSAPDGPVLVPDPFGAGGGGGSDEPVEVIVHDAHLPGHSALWLPNRGVLLAGDMFSDVEPPLPFEANRVAYEAYRDGLDALAPYVTQADVVVPGHGRPADRATAAQRLDADRRQIDALIATSGRDDLG
jgi:glyoxylase-like metal-dependent hydrolase (beta-lactamase superfamily II)